MHHQQVILDEEGEMRLFKTIMLVIVMGMFVSAAWAGNIPEYDAVGCDNCNVFAMGNFLQFQQVVWKNYGPDGPINFYSDFYDEYFRQTAGQLFPDPCFGCSREVEGMYLQVESALTDAWNEAVYEWQIVLQMKPESDINLNIYDCVLKHNSFTPWGDFPYIEAGAEQTGRYRADWGQLFFVPSANPLVTVTAYPGPYATPGFSEPMILDARTLPTLELTPMDGKLYTSKALWDEDIVLALPQTGVPNMSSQMGYNLKQGDKIKVTIEIPYNNTADIRYGPDNVILKYIGITGTWYYGDDCYWNSVDVELTSG
jgi:hypothetical protein